MDGVHARARFPRVHSPTQPDRVRGPPSSLFQGYRNLFSPGIKRPRGEHYRSPLFNSEVNNDWSYTFTTPPAFIPCRQTTLCMLNVINGNCKSVLPLSWTGSLSSYMVYLAKFHERHSQPNRLYNSVGVLFSVATFRISSGWSPSTIVLNTWSSTPFITVTREIRAVAIFVIHKVHKNRKKTEYDVDNSLHMVI